MSETVLEKNGIRFLVLQDRFPEGVFHVMTTADVNMKLDPEKYTDKIRELVQEFDLKIRSLSTTTQVHGKTIGIASGEDRHFEGTDALLGGEGDLLTIKTADCVPIALFDRRYRKTALIHAGWRGSFLRIATETAEAMRRQYGTRPEDLLVHIGTAISKCSFEVERDVIDRYEAEFDFEQPMYEQKNSRKYCLDLRELNRKLLIEFGIPPENISVSEHSTDEALFHSFRRDGKEKYGLMVTMFCCLPLEK